MAKDKPGAGTFTHQEQVKTVTNEVRFACSSTVHDRHPPSPHPPHQNPPTHSILPNVTLLPPKVIEKVLGSHTLFDAERVGDLADQVGSNAVAALVTQCGDAQGRIYRFVITTTIVQRKGAGLSTSSAVAWNETTDFNVTVLWENQALTCVVVVFALAV